MVDNERVRFDPIAMRVRLAERNEQFAASLEYPLYADEEAALLPGSTEYYAYRGLPPRGTGPARPEFR